MTILDHTYDEAMRQLADDLEDILASIEAHLARLRGELRRHLETGDHEGVPENRTRLSLAVGLHDETTDDLAEVRRLIDARAVFPPV